MRTRRSATLALATGVLIVGIAACGSPRAPDPESSLASVQSGPNRTTAAPTTQRSVPAAATAVPSAHPIGQEKQVGPLFGSGADAPHGCSASVVHSPGHDLLITAAHCIHGTGAGELFEPAYRDGSSPYLTWRVERAWVSPGWVSHGDPDLDVALLQVSGRVVGGRTEQVEDLVGAEVLGRTPPSGTIVSVVGYTRGINDRQITCRNALTLLDEFPAFSCHGYVGGTSGSPFLTGSDPGVVVGVVGGRDEGGCSEATSYSAPFGAAVRTLYGRAVAHDPANTVPTQANDC